MLRHALLLGLSIAASIVALFCMLRFASRVGAGPNPDVQVRVETSISEDREEWLEFVGHWPLRGSFYPTAGMPGEVFGAEGLNNPVQQALHDVQTGLSGRLEMHLCQPTPPDRLTRERDNYFTGFRLRLQDENGQRWGICSRLLGSAAAEDYRSFLPRDAKFRETLSRFAQGSPYDASIGNARESVHEALRRVYLASDHDRDPAAHDLVRHIVLLFLRSEAVREMARVAGSSDELERNPHRYFATMQLEGRWTYLLDGF